MQLVLSLRNCVGEGERNDLWSKEYALTAQTQNTYKNFHRGFEGDLSEEGKAIFSGKDKKKNAT